VQEILPAHHNTITDPSASPNPNPSSSSSSSRGQLPGVVIAKGPDGVLERHQADVIVLAAGVPALQQLLRSSPMLAAAGMYMSWYVGLGVGCRASFLVAVCVASLLPTRALTILLLSSFPAT
jgi:hypothetical protein